MAKCALPPGATTKLVEDMFSGNTALMAKSGNAAEAYPTSADTTFQLMTHAELRATVTVGGGDGRTEFAANVTTTLLILIPEQDAVEFEPVSLDDNVAVKVTGEVGARLS